MVKAVQQFMLGTVMNTEAQAADTMASMKAAGYDGIELCGFMLHPSSLMVRLMTKAAGMPVGKGGRLPWPRLVKDSGLQVVSLHLDLGSVERGPAAVAAEARQFGTDKIVITGMYRFPYGEAEAVKELAARLNRAGAALNGEGVSLLYHNHNCEFLCCPPSKTAKSILISAAVRLSAFILPQILGITCRDNMELGMMGDRKQAVFAVIPDNDDTLCPPSCSKTFLH